MQSPRIERKKNMSRDTVITRKDTVVTDTTKQKGVPRRGIVIQKTKTKTTPRGK